MKTHKKLLLMGTFFLTFLYFTDFTFATTESKPYIEKFDDLINTVVKFFNFASQIVAVLLALLTYLSTMFLSPEWINGSFFGIHTYLKSIWVLVSNLVYFVFAFILIGIAFMNIVGMQNDKFQLKQALPKFIVGILIVPFSWFIVNFILAFSSVLTIGALNLPYETFKGYSDRIGQVSIPLNCVLNLEASSLDHKGKTEDTESDPWFYCPDGDKLYTTIMESNKSSSGIFGTIALYTYGILGIENAASFNQVDVQTIKNMGDLLVKVVFDALFILVYAILMIALGLVLMVRGVYIWIYMMLSPVFGLMFFFDKKEGGESLFSKMNIKDFLSLAMVPVYSMLALSFGMLFLFVVGEGMTTTDGKFKSDIKLDSTKEGEVSISILADDTDKGGMSLTIKGAAANPQNITDFNSIFGDSAGGTLGVIGSLILKIFGIVVLWGAIMAALKTNKITEAVVKPLEQFGSKVGEITKASPSYLPIFGGQSMQSLDRVGGQISGSFQNKATDKATKFLGESGLADVFGIDKNLGQLEKIAQDFKSGSLTNPQRVAKLRELLSISKDNNALYANEKNREALFAAGKDMLKANGMKDLKIESASDINSLAKVQELIAKIDKDPKFQNTLEGAVTKDNVASAIDNLREGKEKGSSQTSTTGTNATDKANQISIAVENVKRKTDDLFDGKKLKENVKKSDLEGVLGGITDKDDIKKVLDETSVKEYAKELAEKIVEKLGESDSSTS